MGNLYTRNVSRNIDLFYSFSISNDTATRFKLGILLFIKKASKHVSRYGGCVPILRLKSGAYALCVIFSVHLCFLKFEWVVHYNSSAYLKSFASFERLPLFTFVIMCRI